VLIGLSVLALGTLGATATDDMPAIPATVETVSDAVKQRTIHGWHSSRLVMLDGTLYAAGTVADPDGENDWQDRGLLYRRSLDGSWSVAGETPNQPYHMCVGADGRFWVVAPARYHTAEVFRSKTPGSPSDLELVYNGTCAYLGASVNEEGDFLLLHARDGTSLPNSVVAKFYEAATGEWHTSEFPTPEGRCGYEGIVLRGKSAFAIVNSSANPPPDGATTQESSPWRTVRLARCDDLTRGEWVTRVWLDPPYGSTGLSDMYSDGDTMYVTYSHRAADSLEAFADAPGGNYIARVRWDMSVETFAFPVAVGGGRIVRDSRGAFYFVGRSGDELHVWDMDVADDFALSNERRVAGSAGKLMNYVIHTLRPQRFGGETDGDTVHLLSTTVSDDPDSETFYHVAFDLR
jgi:hypothetical protein